MADSPDLKPRIFPRYIEDEMKDSYLDYAMSVIIGRALPDVRDGLKPVHRRILFGMSELGLGSGRPFKKSARIVGEVLGKFHPHGDIAIYDTLVRMAQDFAMRYPLVDGHGNFGSIDGDSAAAHRYTEARLDAFSDELLNDLDKETVDFTPNFDESLNEPTVLPARVPNLLINGSAGIAVGMATNIPPHNLGEIVDGVVHAIDHPDCTVLDLMQFVQGPDFPTGAYITNRAEMRQIYETGRGRVALRSKVDIETDEKKGKTRLIVREIPYQQIKSRMIETMASLVTDKKIEGITDIRDESNREGIRVIIELRRGEEPELILNQLYKMTTLDTSFGVIMLAIVDKRPKVLNLKQMFDLFIAHRIEVVTRRTRFELKKAEARAHILEGLRIALDNIDAVIAAIKGSKDVPSAEARLIADFDLSEIQAKAIVEMRLGRLTGLEREKIDAEYSELVTKIAEYKAILADEVKVRAIIKAELMEAKKKYGDPRRTEFLDDVSDITREDLVKDETVVVTLSHSGFIKRIPLETYRTQHRGGKGLSGSELVDDDFVEFMHTANSKDYLFFFTNLGRLHALKVWEVPETSRRSKGRSLVNLLKLDHERAEKVAAIIPVDKFDEEHFVVLATLHGVIKKTPLVDYRSAVSRGIIAINLDEGDELIGAAVTDGTRNIILGTKDGQAIRFDESEVRAIGRASRGVRGIDLAAGDSVIDMAIVEPIALATGDDQIVPESKSASASADASFLFTVTENGYGKRTRVSGYRRTHRGGKGIINLKITGDNGPAVSMIEVRDRNEIILVTAQGMLIRTQVDSVTPASRGTIGRILIRMSDGDRVVSASAIEPEEEDLALSEGDSAE